MKKWCKLLATLMLATSLLVPSPAWAVGRNDKINALKNEGVVTGYPDGSLGLDRPISRAEVSVLLIRMTGDGAPKFLRMCLRATGRAAMCKRLVA